MQVDVKFKKPIDGHIDWAEVERVLSGLQILRQLPPLRIFTVETDSVASLLAHDSVEWVEPVVNQRPDVSIVAPVPNDPFCTEQWALARMNVYKAHEYQQGTAGIVVAVVDTGLYKAHEEFTSKAWTGYAVTGLSSWSTDADGHGTACTSCIAPSTGNSKGVAGVAPNVTVLTIKCNAGGEFPSSQAAEGILLAEAYGANIISYSNGSDTFSQVVHDAVEYVIGQGCLFVKSAGNAGETGGYTSYPKHDDALTVASLNAANRVAAHSSYDDTVGILAPGENILCAIPGAATAYAEVTGTSFACPHVSAVAALVWSENPSYTAQEIKQVLLSTVSEVEDPLLVSKFGTEIGCVDALKAVLKARGDRTGTKTAYIRFYGEGVVDAVADGQHVITAQRGAMADVGAFGGDEVVQVTQRGQFVYRGPSQNRTPFVLVEDDSPLSFVP